MTLAGPNARELLSRVVDADVSREALPFFRSAHLDLDSCTVFVLRLSFVGELGFELHVRTDYARRVEARAARGRGGPRARRLRLPRAGVHAAGEGLPDVGLRPDDRPRRRSRRAWGSPSRTRAGRSRAARSWRARRRRASSGRWPACWSTPDDADAHAWEPVYDGDRAVSHVASGGYGHRVERSIAYAYLPLELATPGRALEVEILGQRRPAVVAEAPLYDPANERLRG